MKFGLEQMNSVIESIITNKLSHSVNVVIGDNSSGKSLMLKKFIEQTKLQEQVYFIDSVNRVFDVKKISKSGNKPAYKTTILETRLKEQYFNLVDSFNCFGTLTERVEMIYPFYEKEVQELFFKLTGERFQILSGNLMGEVQFENGNGLLSSGYQALVRILLEILYYQDTVAARQKGKNFWIVIDELDEFLSPKYSASILNFLRNEFPWAKWLVTTHSCDLLAHTKDANLIVLDNSTCEVIDLNDYSSVSEVQIIFERLFGKHTSADNEIESTLRRLFNNRINGAWGPSDDAYLKQLQEQHLSASQKVILKQIQEW